MAEYVKVSRAGIKPGLSSPVSLYVYLPLNKKVVPFKTAGVVLTETDCEHLKFVGEGCLVVLKSDMEARMKASAAKIQEKIPAAGGQITEEIQKEAGNVLKGLSSVVGSAEGGRASEELTKLHEITSSIVSSVKEAASGKAYGKLIEALKAQGDPLTVHQKQVSALAVMFCLAEGKGSAEEMVEVASAGLIHDLGMSLCGAEAITTHCTGQSEEALFQDPNYKEHTRNAVKFAEEKIDGTKLSQISKQAVLYHHEYLDQTGLLGTSGLGIPRCARFLRVADDVICTLNQPGNNKILEDILAELTYANLMKYDRMITSAIHRHFLSSET